MTGVAGHCDLLDRVRARFAPLTGPGRALGAAIADDADATRRLADLPLMRAVGQLGLDPGASHAERIAIYETLGHIDLNIAAAAPGPVMTGFVVEALGCDVQKAAFRAIFEARPAWSCFALTEPDCGTDAGAMTTRAEAVADGWRLDGRKYMVGQGVTADVTVVFARTAPGPLGIDAFLVRPAEHPGYRATRLPLTGIAGTNLSEIRLDGVVVAPGARLGAHLSAADRSRRMLSATLDAMRPCLGAMGLGLARAALDRAEAEGLVDAAWSAPYRRRLAALLEWALKLGAARDRGVILDRDAGLMKAGAVAAAETTITALLLRAGAGAMAAHPWLRRAWCDASAFEYMEPKDPNDDPDPSRLSCRAQLRSHDHAA